MKRLLIKLSFVTHKRLASLFLSLLLFTTYSPLLAQMSSVTPVEYTNGMTNPLMGFRNNVSVAKSNYPYITLVRQYIEYNVLDNNPNDGVQKIIDYTNAKFLDFEKYNVKVIPRVILMWDLNKTHFPSDIPYKESEWSSEVLKFRVQNLIAKLGQAWDNDPRIAFIETGLIGQWGEQESPVGIDEAVVGTNRQTWAQVMEPEFIKAFKNKKCMVRSMHKWTDNFLTGVYWDSYGAYKRMTSSTDDYQQLLLWNKPPYERYKIVPIQGEVAYSQSEPGHMGTDEDSTVRNANYRQWFIDNIRSTQSTTCGLEYNAALSANDIGASLIQKAFGYRFLIKKFECTPRTEPGSNLSFSAKIVNDGSAPIYENWPLAVVIINETTKQIIHKSIIPTADITKWLPGTNYDWIPQATPNFGTGTRVYKTPAVENTIEGTIQIPANLAVGQYLVGLSILDPTTLLPGVYFSVQNYFRTSNSQPLCRIGVGTNASSFTLNSTMFDAYDWRSGDTRYYAKTYMPMAVSGINISNSTLSIMKGKAKQLSSTLVPTYATNKNVTWSSSNTAVATVNSSGLVTGVSIGNAAITVTTADGGFNSTCNLTVTEFIPCDLPWSKSDFTITTSSKLYSSGPIDISCDSPVTLSMNLAENTGLEGSDTLFVIYKIDGVENIAAKLVNDFTSLAVNKAGINGNRLEITIRGTQDSPDEIYSITKLKVTGNSPDPNAVEKFENRPAGLVNIYPNPVANTLFIEHPKNSTIRIYSIQGQLLYNKAELGTNSTIEVANLKTKGLVFVHVLSGNNASVFKVTVLK